MIRLALLICALFLNGSINGQKTEAVESAFEHLLEFPNVRDFAMTSTADEAYISIQSPLGEFSVIAQMNKVGDAWSNPEIVSFSGTHMDLEPFLASNNLRLYFASNRPLDPSVKESKDFDIWYVDRKTKNSGWGNPINLGEPINTEENEFYPSIAQNGNLYFTSDRPDSKGKDDIFFSALKGDDYSAPLPLSDAINTEGYEYNAYISLDETYIIFGGYNREGGMGSGDLYISFRDENQVWGQAINLGKSINSKQMDYCPFVDVNTMTMYFTSKRSAISQINDFVAMEDVIMEMNKSENGMSRLYKASFEAELARLKSE